MPKRKNPSTASAQRASSATPSISSSTPRVTATRAESVLPTTEEFNLGDDESSSATAAAATDPPVERTNTVDLSSVAPVAAVSTVRGASFAPSDPSQSQRQTQTQASSSQSQPPSSLGLSFGPQDPSLSSQATTVFANSQDERRAPGLSRSPSRKTQGTAFGVSSTAPSVRQPASAAPSSVPPASPSPRIAPQPSSSNASGRTALDSLAAAARVAAHVERQTENDGDSETGHAPADDDDDNADEHDDAPPAKRSRVARNKAKGKEKEAESTMQEKAEAARQKRLENKAKRDAKNKGKAAALASALAPASSVVGRARIIDLEPGPEAGPSSRNEQSNGEGAASERQLVEGAERVQQLPPPKRKRGRPRKTPIAAEDAAAEQNDEAGPASIAANSSSNQRAPVVKSAKAKGKQKDVDAGEDDDDDKSDAEPQKPVSKRRRAAEAARAKTNNWLFNSSSDDDSDAFEPEGAARKDGGAADGDDAGMDDELSTEGEDRVGANGRVFKGKGKGKGGKGTRKGGRKQPAEIVVDSSTTLMADIATALDLVAGRESTRGPKLAKKLEERAQRQKEARERTKRHRQRRAEGLNSETEEDEHEREQEGAIDDGAENGAAPEVAGTHAPASEGSPAPAAIAQDDDEAAPANGFEDLIRRQNDGEEGSGPGSDEDEDEAEIEEAQPDADADTEAGGGDDYSGLKETRAPQMRLVGDRLVIDEDSLEIDRVADVSEREQKTRFLVVWQVDADPWLALLLLLRRRLEHSSEIEKFATKIKRTS